MRPPYQMKRVFLVEDNHDNADLICDLVGAEYHIEHFPDAHSALAALTKQNACKPHLLLLDISLPGMDGTCLLRQIRSDERLKDIPAVALTAHAMKTDKESLIAAGFDAYLSKPITDDQLLFQVIRDQISN